MKFTMDHHFIYIIVCIDEHKQQLQSYYKLKEEDLEEITKEWSVDLLIPTDPMEISDIDSPEVVHDTPRSRKTKKNEDGQDVSSTFAKTTSISVEKGRDGREIDGVVVEQKKGDVTPPRDEEDPSKKRKFSPLKPSSLKKMKSTKTKFETTLTSDDFDFIVVDLNDALLDVKNQISI
jgi:hypothetical protein